MSPNCAVSGSRSVSLSWSTIWNDLFSSTRHRSRPTWRRPPAGPLAGSASSITLRSATGARRPRGPVSRPAGRALGHRRRHERRDVRVLHRTPARSDAQGRDVVILDNLSSHKSYAAAAALRGIGAWFLFLPPYSPDLVRGSARSGLIAATGSFPGRPSPPWKWHSPS